MNAREWSSRIAELARREHSALADLLLAVAEFDEQAVHRQLGFSSLFDFLHREIGLSRGSAYYRQVGARMLRRFPEVEEPIRDGRLCVTTVSELAKVMTEENRAVVLPRFFGCSRQEAKQLVAELRPAAEVPRRTVVTEVPLLAPVEPTAVGAAPAIVQPVGRDRTHPGRGVHAADGARTEAPRTVVEPMTATETRMHVTVSPEFVKLLRKAKAGQSHVQPGATDEQVLTAALELLVAQQEKRRASVPPRVKREVMKRDEGKCTWPMANGGVCGSEVRLEVDHVVPRGRGGPSTVENCRILCRAHNLEAARRAYGDEVMDLFAPRNPVAREPCAAYELGGGGVTSGPATAGGAAGRASGTCGMAIQSAMYRMIPQPPAKMERMKSTRASAIGMPKRSARPRQTPAIIRPSRALYHSRPSGGCDIQLVQWLHRTAPGWFSVRQYGQVVIDSSPPSHPYAGGYLPISSPVRATLPEGWCSSRRACRPRRSGPARRRLPA